MAGRARPRPRRTKWGWNWNPSVGCGSRVAPQLLLKGEWASLEYSGPCSLLRSLELTA